MYIDGDEERVLQYKSVNASDLRGRRVEKHGQQTIKISGRWVVGFTVCRPLNETRKAFHNIVINKRRTRTYLLGVILVSQIFLPFHLCLHILGYSLLNHKCVRGTSTGSTCSRRASYICSADLLWSVVKRMGKTWRRG